MRALDMEAVQAFVLVADLKSFTRAAEALDTTQSGVSLRIKRLEDRLGRRLLERTPRLVRLSADGAAFLPGARAMVTAQEMALASMDAAPWRLVVGFSDHVAGPGLPSLLQRMHRSQPALLLELRVATSRDLLAGFERGEMDAAIVLRHDATRRGGETLTREPFGWMAAPEFEWSPRQALRLATQAEPCGVREAAVAALEAAGIAWTEVFVGGGVGTTGAAASAGLAVAPLGRRSAPRDVVDAGGRLGLPELPAFDVVLHSSVSDPRGRTAIRALAASVRAGSAAVTK